MRYSFLITYDISDPKRLRMVFNLMKGYGEHLQLSVFLCELSLKEKALLIWKLNDIINHKDDSVMFTKIGPVNSNTVKKIEFIGSNKVISDRRAVIV